jgi:hypothetical protein
MNRDVSAALARANLSMEQTLEAMQQGTMPIQQAQQTVESLNRLALSLLTSAQQMEHGEAGAPGQQATQQQLADLARQQGSLNGQANSLQPMNLSAGAMSQQLNRLAAEQMEIARRLGNLGEGGRNESVLGDVDALAGEAEALARRMQGGGLSPEVLARQERLFHRLLDAGRTLEKDEYEDERVGERARGFDPRNAGALDPRLFDDPTRFRAPTHEELQALPPAYRRHDPRLLRAAQPPAAERARRRQPVTVRVLRRAAPACVLAMLLLADAAAGQTVPQPVERDLSTELGRIRDATLLETAGDLDGAEAIVRSVLQENPASLTALITFERLLGVQGRPADVLPAADRLVALDQNSVIGHQVRLRVFSQLDDVPRLERAVAAWVRAMPTLETPYRDAALIWRQRGEPARAVAILEQGRRRIDRVDALALELGDAWADAGDLQKAAAEWARAVGAEGRGFLLVQRRLQNQPEGGARAIPALIDQLSAGRDATVGRRKAAALLAIEAGLEPRAARLTRELAGQVPAAEREQLLVELARRADAAGMYGIALWSYDELLRGARDAGAALAIRTRVAELALLAGDTARAAEVYEQLEVAAATGSPQRRQAVALRLQLTIREGDFTGAAREFEAFRAEFPQAPETDGTAALLAERLLEDGRPDEAQRVLHGVGGPRSALLRGRLHIRRGELQQARDELLSAAPLLHGREATETIALAALLMRVSVRGGELVAGAVAADVDERERIVRDAADAPSSCWCPWTACRPTT